jgi:glutamate dehydrogenase
LYDNYLQAQILSQEEEVSVQRMESYEELMLQLEADGECERDVEFLPSTEEMGDRRAAGQGLTRPELAVLLAYAKRQVYAALLDSDLPDTDYLGADLARYFPPMIVERFGPMLADHPLKREIIATLASNDVVNSQGITFVTRMGTETGASHADVVKAFRIARDITGAVGRWSDVEALDGLVDPAVQSELLSGVDWLVETTSRWYLVQAAGQRLAEAVEQAGASFAEVSHAISQVGPEGWREEHELVARRLIAEGVPETVAYRHAFQPELVHAPDIIAVAHATGRSPLEVARGFFVLGEQLDIDWIEAALEKMQASTRWQRWAQQSMEDDLFALRRRLCERVLESAGGAPIDEAIERFFEERAQTTERVMRFLRSLKAEGVTDLSQLTVALRQIRSLAG